VLAEPPVLLVRLELVVPAELVIPPIGTSG